MSCLTSARFPSIESLIAICCARRISNVSVPFRFKLLREDSIYNLYVGNDNILRAFSSFFNI